MDAIFKAVIFLTIAAACAYLAVENWTGVKRYLKFHDTEVHPDGAFNPTTADEILETAESEHVENEDDHEDD